MEIERKRPGDVPASKWWQRGSPVVTTMLNPRLPRELLDYIVDLLHDTRDALESCCLVSKSWVPRTRKHLFARVSIHTSSRLQSWKNTFPDPSGSPAFLAKYLLVGPQHITTADGEEGGWIPTFSHVVHFRVDVRETSGSLITLVPFHGFSPNVETLHITLPAIYLSHIFDLILSFPLLGSITVITHGPSIENAEVSDDGSLALLRPPPLNLPAFTGVLELSIGMGMGPIASRLLSLSGCLRFRKIRLILHCQNDILLAKPLVESCSATLESLYLKWTPIHTMFIGVIDLSKATKLKDVTFVSEIDPEWIVSSLRTITSDHQNLHQISIHTTIVLHNMKPTRAQWLELDSVLVKLWESHWVQLEARYYFSFSVDPETARKSMESLFPETTSGGIVDLSLGGCFLETRDGYL